MDFPQFNKQIAEELQHAGGTSGGLAKYLDFRHIEFSAGRLVVEMDARADLLTPSALCMADACQRWSTTAWAWCSIR